MNIGINTLDFDTNIGWVERVELAIQEHSTPILENFNYGLHMEACDDLAKRYNLKTQLKNNETECWFVKRDSI